MANLDPSSSSGSHVTDVPFWHPPLDATFRRGVYMNFFPSSTHPKVHELFLEAQASLDAGFPADHPNIDDVLSSGTPIPDWHQEMISLDQFLFYTSVKADAVSSLPFLHPDVEASYRSGTRAFAGHPRVHALYASLPYFPPSHPDVDSCLAAPSAHPLPPFHPPLNAYVLYSARGPPVSAGAVLCLLLLLQFLLLAIAKWAYKLFKWAAGNDGGSKSFVHLSPQENEMLDRGYGLQSVSVVAADEEATANAANQGGGEDGFEVVGSSAGLKKRLGGRGSVFFVPAGEATGPLRNGTKNPMMAVGERRNDEEAAQTADASEGLRLRGAAPMSLPSMNKMLHASEELHKQHRGPDLYEYGEGTAYRAVPPEGEIDVDVDGDEGVKAKTVTLRHAIFSMLTNMRIPRTQKTLGNVFFFLLYVALHAVSLLATADPASGAIDYSRGFGSLAAANSAILIVPATRNSILTFVLGMPFDHVVVYHRFCGRSALLCGAIHFAFFINKQSDRMVYFTGLGALLFGAVIGATSIDYMRRKHFNVFFWSHSSFIGYYVLAFFHVKQCRPFVLGGVTLYVLDYALRTLWTWFPMKTLVFQNKGDGVAQVRFRKNPLTELLGLHTVGQYYFVNFPAISLSEWHPFSVSSGPREDGVELHIRALGDHTKLVVELSKKMALEKKQTWIRIDGPYGKMDFNFRRYPVVFLCGGGVGITPIMGIMKDIYNVGGYGKNGEGSKFQRHSMQCVYAMWIVPTLDDADWFMRELKACMRNATNIDGMPKLVVWVHITKAKVGTVEAPYIAGRPKMVEVFSTMEECYPKSALLCYACGPAAMVNETWDLCTQRTRGGGRVDFRHETFEF